MRLRSFSRVSASTTLVVALLLACLPGGQAQAADDGWEPPVSSVTDANTVHCADYLFVGVRGSGEKSGWGSTVENANEALRANISKVGGLRGAVRSVYIDYTAASVDVLGGDLKTLGLSKKYLASVVNGYLKLNRVLQDSYERCHKRTNDKWILAGYSQGALVVSQVLSDMKASARGQVAGVQLVADPANWKGRTLVRVGKDQNKRGRGVWTEFHGLVGLSKSLAARVYNVCDHGDVVCDFDNARVDGLSKGATIHGSYAGDGRFKKYFEGLAQLIVQEDRVGVRKQSTAGYLIPDDLLTVFDQSTGGYFGYGHSPAYGFDTYNHNIQCYIAPGEDSSVFACGISSHTWTIPRGYPSCGHVRYVGLEGFSNAVYGSDGATLHCGDMKIVPRQRNSESTATSGAQVNPVLPAGSSITAWGVTCTAGGSGLSSFVQCRSKSDNFRISASSIAYNGS